MRREFHVRFCEGGGVRAPSATRLVILCRTREEADAALAEVRAWVSENGCQRRNKIASFSGAKMHQ